MTLSVGVIGVGIMGAEHARIVRDATPGVVLAGIHDLDPDKAAASAGPDTKVFADAKSLINSRLIDAVLIASPDSTHMELALECIRIGKPALCEKPLGVTADEARHVVGAEIAAGRRCVQMGFMRRFDCGYVELARQLADGAIGTPFVLHNIHRNAAAPEWYTSEMSITNAFIHEIDTTRWLLGEEIRSLRVLTTGRPDPLLVTMQAQSGALISSEIFMNCAYGYEVGTQVVGSKGTIETVAPLTARLRQNGAVQDKVPQLWIPRFVQAYTQQIRAWTSAVVADCGPAGASAWDGYVNGFIADGALRSLAKDAQIDISVPERPGLYA